MSLSSFSFEEQSGFQPWLHSQSKSGVVRVKETFCDAYPYRDWWYDLASGPAS